MRLLFEVVKFAFELLYASYQYEMEQMKDEHHIVPSPPEIEFAEELNE